MKIDFTNLDYKFSTKPLLVGGKAMEYYQLRKAGEDIDFIVTAEDYVNLAKKFPENTQDLYGDLGVTIHDFELWKCIQLFDYSFLSQKAMEEENYLIISLEKLLLMKTLAMNASEKYLNDVKLIAQKINNIQYGKDKQFDKDFFKNL